MGECAGGHCVNGEAHVIASWLRLFLCIRAASRVYGGKAHRLRTAFAQLLLGVGFIAGGRITVDCEYLA